MTHLYPVDTWTEDDAERASLDASEPGTCPVCDGHLGRAWDETYPRKCTSCGAEVWSSVEAFKERYRRA